MNQVQLPQILIDLMEHLCLLPGVGRRTAQRYTLSLLQWPKEERDQLARALGRVNEVKLCSQCFAFAEEMNPGLGLESDKSEVLCIYCAPQSQRHRHQVCVVESFADLMAIERTQGYRGLYHVLGGLLGPLKGVGPNELKLKELIERVSDGEIKEVILALNPSMEGDATCSYLGSLLTPYEVAIQRLGQGIPMGSSLEHLDPLTISSALTHRKVLL